MGGVIADVLAVSGITAVVTALIIGLIYMIGTALSEPRVTLWSKTEIVQLMISIASAFFLIILIQSFCSIDAGSVSSLFMEETEASVSGNLFDGAEMYLTKTAVYTHDVMVMNRFHMMAYNILSTRSRWECEGLDCLFGASGITLAPYAWTSVWSTTLNVANSSAMFAYMASLNYLIVLKYINSGMVLFFLPVGIFFRALPFLRNIGSVFIALAVAFMIVYPLVLTTFYLMEDPNNPVLFSYDPLKPKEISALKDEKHLRLTFRDAFASAWDYAYFGAKDEFAQDYVFDEVNDVEWYDILASESEGREMEVMVLAGRAFLVGVFIPTVALIAAIASVSYVGRMLGQEIDLSRLTQVI